MITSLSLALSLFPPLPPFLFSLLHFITCLLCCPSILPRVRYIIPRKAFETVKGKLRNMWLALLWSQTWLGLHPTLEGRLTRRHRSHLSRPDLPGINAYAWLACTWSSGIVLHENAYSNLPKEDFLAEVYGSRIVRHRLRPYTTVVMPHEDYDDFYMLWPRLWLPEIRYVVSHQHIYYLRVHIIIVNYFIFIYTRSHCQSEIADASVHICWGDVPMDLQDQWLFMWVC
jgi:hypothetical protein